MADPSELLVSNQDLCSTVLDLSSIILDHLVEGMRSKADTAFFGSGSNDTTTIKGISAHTLPSMAVDGELTFNALLAAKAKIQRKHVTPGPSAPVPATDDVEGLEGVKDNTGCPLSAPDITAAVNLRFGGIPMTVTDRIPNTTRGTPAGRGLLADMSGCVVVRDLSGQAIVLKGRQADTDETCLRAVARFDLAVPNPDKFLTITGITRA